MVYSFLPSTISEDKFSLAKVVVVFRQVQGSAVDVGQDVLECVVAADVSIAIAVGGVMNPNAHIL